MRDMTDSLDAVRVAGLWASMPASRSLTAGQRLMIEVVETTSSTNADLRERVDTLTGPLLLAAERQTAGRGRAGRSWLAEAGNSLCFSLAWPFTGPLHRLAGLSLAVGVVLAECLRAQGTPVTLKWPNDLLVDGAKLGGILIETASGASRERAWAVIGVGLNVRVSAARDAAVGQPVASLAARSETLPAGAAGNPAAAATAAAAAADADADAIDRNHLLARLADALTAGLLAFERDGLAPFVTRWEVLHAHAGQAVSIVEQGRVLHQGIALGIDASGCLRLETSAGIITVAAGDVSLRARASVPAASPDSEAPHALH